MRFIQAIVIFTTALVTSCASNWVGVDGAHVDQSAIARARSSCQVEEKTQMLKSTRAFTESMATKSGDSADQLNQAFHTFVRRVNDDIAKCMRNQGLIAS